MSFTIIKDYYKDQGNKIVKKKSKEKSQYVLLLLLYKSI